MNWLPSVREGSNPHLPQDSPGLQDRMSLSRGDLLQLCQVALWSGMQESSGQKENRLEASDKDAQLGGSKYGNLF